MATIPWPAFVKEHGPLLEDALTDQVLRELCDDPIAAIAGAPPPGCSQRPNPAAAFQLDTQGDQLCFSFDVRLPVSFPVEDALPHSQAGGSSWASPWEITKRNPGYYVPADDPMVTMLTDLYNNETNSQDQPYVMGACTYARLFRHGCGFGGGNPHEVKPFPAGHGAAHGPDEAHNIPVLLDAIKMYILGIKAIDERWG